MKTKASTKHAVATREEWLKARRYFLLIVVLPTLLTAGYYLLIASDQYESEAHFMVRAAQETPTTPSGISQVLDLAGGATETQSEAMSVGDYLNSHDAVAALRDNAQLVERFRRPEIDLLSWLHSANPKAETLLKYYRKHVDVDTASDTGLTTLRVRTFRPEDSYAIINALLKLGEQRVNELNLRVYQDTLAVANRELDEAKAAVTQSQSTMTGSGNDGGSSRMSKSSSHRVSPVMTSFTPTSAQMSPA